MICGVRRSESSGWVFDDVHLPMLCSVSMRDDDNKRIYTIEKHNIIVYKCVDCVLYCQ